MYRVSIKFIDTQLYRAILLIALFRKLNFYAMSTFYNQMRYMTMLRI